MIETLFAGINGWTIVPGKKNFYASEYENYCEVKAAPDDELVLTYENGFSASFEETNVSKADPASVISCDGYGSWSYNILLPKSFVMEFLNQRIGVPGHLAGGRESLMVQSMIEPMYAIYKEDVGTDRLVDFIPWIVKQINAHAAKTFKNIYISDYTFPQVRKIQYLNQDETINANTDQGTQFGLSSTKYLRRKNIGYVDKTESFYRLAIDVKTNPTVFAANNYRTDLTINDFDVHTVRIDNFYVIHPKIEAIDKAYIEKSFNCTNDAVENTILKTDHLLFDGQEIYFSLLKYNGGGPKPLVVDAFRQYINYYVVNATKDTFQLSLTAGGSPINMTLTYDCIAVYKAGVPLTIDNYPEFKVKFGTSKLYEAPTISNFQKREELNLLDRSLTLKNSLTAFKQENDLNLAQSGQIFYLNGMYPISKSGYLYTGNTIQWFESNVIDKRYPGSGAYDALQSGDSNIIQIGTVKSWFKFTNRGLNYLTDYIGVNYYNINANSGIFKSVNETGFFTSKNNDAIYKSGIYTKLLNNAQKYLSINYDELVESVNNRIPSHPKYWTYNEAVKEKLGYYGASNPYYLKSGFVYWQRYQADFYLFAYTNGLNQGTNEVEITGISLSPVDQFKKNAKEIIDLGPTENQRYIINDVTDIYDKSN